MRPVPAGLIAHLKLLQEWGVEGFSTDRRWTSRAPDEAARAPGPAGAAAGPDVSQSRDAAPVDREGSSRAPSAARSPLSTERDAESMERSAESMGRDATPMERGGFSRASPLAGSGGAALAALRADLGDCTRCKLHTLGRRQIVFGVGNPAADLMFVGEAPGYDEDVQGEPFVGRAGQLLTKIIEAMGLRREDVYIANIIKCRPPDNRNPEPDEIAQCEPFLIRQIEIVQPGVVVALGNFAAKALLRTSEGISRLRGRVYEYHGARLVPTFHPAFLLRSPNYKRDTWEDMKKVMAILRGGDDSDT
jgi:DNA polymerase